jgi:nucleotide-binding universal stress UspA family protein
MTNTESAAPPGNILLATDLSSRSDRALDRASQLASEWNARLHVVHALAPDTSAVAAGLAPETCWSGPGNPREQAERRLRKDLGPLMEKLHPHIHIERGTPGQAILDIEKKQDCGVIVTGVARDESLGRMLLGDTVDFLARKANVPVLVVRKRPSGPYTRVIAATDFSPASAEAVKAARGLFPGAGLTLLHAYHIPFSGILMNDGIRAEFQELGEQATSEFLRSQGLPEDMPHIVEQGAPDEVVARHADAQGSLIVVGSHGASGLAGILLGSTARQILNRTDGDVLLVPFTRRESA